MSVNPEKMQALRRRFVAAAADQADRLDSCVRQGDLEGARTLAHGLAGRAGMFGYTQLGETARLVDEADLGAIRERAERLLIALRQLAGEGSKTPPAFPPAAL